MELLLSAGADPFFAGASGTALETAARNGDAQTAEVPAGASVSISRLRGNTGVDFKTTVDQVFSKV